MRHMGVVFGVALAAAAVVAAAAASTEVSAPKLAYGLQDDAWIQFGPGTIEERIATLQKLGIRVVRLTVHWDQVEPDQGSFDWTGTDAVLGALMEAGIEPVVTLYGTPGWANGVRAPNVAPTRGADFAAFAGAIAERYPSVHKWTIWNEPNQRRWLSTASPVQYVTRLLNPAYVAIHDASPSSRVAGGVTAPRGGTGGTSPVSFIRGMGRAGARLDAYAHHPYALSPSETPWSGGCAHCQTITMSTIDKLVAETRKAFGRPVRLWLTELGYQSNPPDKTAGVPPATQATYVAAAAYRAWLTPRVDLLIQYLYRDEPGTDRWQSGLETRAGVAKPAMAAVAEPLAQVARRGKTTTVWGTIRPGSGPRAYRLQRKVGNSWVTIGGAQRTKTDGTLRRVVTAAPGATLRLFAGGLAGNTLTVR